ncbi:MAG: GDP-mannose 4,6-dehydratase [Rhodanobacter sp.]
MKKLYLTGASGFVGQHIARIVAEGGFGACTLHAMPDDLDIRDSKALHASLASVQPDWVIHLAARSFVPDSFTDPRETLDVNLFGTLSLLCALREMKFGGRLLYVSSGDVYGAVPESVLPVSELRWPEPRNPYAASKIAAETLCLQWHRSEQLDVIVARPFNHIGPGQGERFVVPALARQVARIAAGLQEPTLVVGDIDVTRDFSDVRDVVRAYAAMLDRGRAGQTYNVCSGREVTIRSILQTLSMLAGVDPAIVQDGARLRPSEQRRMVADCRRLRADTGWEPALPLEASLQQILDTFRTDQTP